MKATCMNYKLLFTEKIKLFKFWDRFFCKKFPIEKYVWRFFVVNFKGIKKTTKNLSSPRFFKPGPQIFSKYYLNSFKALEL